MDFSCPTCNVLLQAQTLEGIRLWKCASCRGFAISLPIVRKGLNSETFKDIWQKLSTGQTDTGRPCPGCRSPLSVVEVDGQGGVIMIDVCRTCQILWFDDKEFSDLPKTERENKLERELSPKAKLTFSAFKKDRLKRRSFLVKLLENDVSKEFDLDSLFGGFFDE